MAGLRMLDAEVSLRCDESWNTGLAEVGACIQWVGQIESAETKRGNPPRLRCATKPFEDWAMNVLIYNMVSLIDHRMVAAG